MILKTLNILLADDDKDDCGFFKEALVGMDLVTHLIIVNDGEQLMNYLTSELLALPHVLFLDINMPRKNGFECLSEIKQNKKLKPFPVIMFSTSFELDVVNQLYQNGAHYFIRKPSEFQQFKKTLQQTLSIISKENILQPPREKFVFEIVN